MSKDCTELDSGENSRWTQSVTRNGHPSMWWPRSIIGFRERLLSPCTTVSYSCECTHIATVHRYSVTYGTECTHITTVHRYSVAYCTECTHIATVHRYSVTYCTECTHITTVHRCSVTYCTECSHIQQQSTDTVSLTVQFNLRYWMYSYSNSP